MTNYCKTTRASTSHNVYNIIYNNGKVAPDCIEHLVKLMLNSIQLQLQFEPVGNLAWNGSIEPSPDYR
jgi:hypothetical protein